MKSFEEGSDFAVDGIDGPLTWNALPDSPRTVIWLTQRPPVRPYI
jgi:hypothetical protein